MQIHGTVIHEPLEPDLPCTYTVEDKAEQKQYTIISNGIQAVKDYIFIRDGQEVQIQGKMIGKDVIETEKSRIKINFTEGVKE